MSGTDRKYFSTSSRSEIMPSTCTRRTVLGVFGIALGLGIMGCTSAESSEPAVSNRTAKRRALAAEESYLTDKLQSVSCLEEWGTTATTASRDATVTNRTSDGVHVEITHPYWYHSERVEADASTNALYIVTADSVERKRGDSVSVSC